MDHLDIFRAMVADFQNDLQEYLRGDAAPYLYLNPVYEAGTAPDGTPLKNDMKFVESERYRARLCYALAYGTEPVPDRHAVLRGLFEAECTARENDRFKGTSYVLWMLSAMLLEYEQPDSPLFARAKNANDGCRRDYEPEECRIEPPEDLTLSHCMCAADLTGMRSYLCTLADLAKQQISDPVCAMLMKEYASVTGRPADRALAVHAIYDAAFAEEKEPALPQLLAAADLVALLSDENKPEEAAEAYLRHAACWTYYPPAGVQSGAALIAAHPQTAERIRTMLYLLVKANPQEIRMQDFAPLIADAEQSGDADFAEFLRQAQEQAADARLDPEE